MYQSEADICNAALYKVGGARIIALTDNSPQARLCKDIYPKAVSRLLRSHPWGFALKRVQCPAITSTPVFEYAKAYQLPADCLRVFKMEDDEVYPWRVEGKVIVTDNPSCKIKYVRSNVAVADYPDDFGDALAGAIAVELSYALSSDNALRREVAAFASQALRTARTTNAQEGTGDRFYADEWLHSRY